MQARTTGSEIKTLSRDGIAPSRADGTTVQEWRSYSKMLALEANTTPVNRMVETKTVTCRYFDNASITLLLSSESRRLERRLHP